MKYLEEDLEAIAKGKANINDIALHYGVSRDTLMRSLNKRGYHVRKVKVKITSPYMRKTVGSIQECADTLKLSVVTIRKALRGQRIIILEELNIQLEVVK